MSEPTELTDDYLDRLQAICDAATEGPWIVCPMPELAPDGYSLMFRGVGTDVYAKNPHATVAGNNQEFTAESRTALPLLIAEVRRLRDEVASAGKDGIVAGIIIGGAAAK